MGKNLGERLDGVATSMGRAMSNPYTFLTVFTLVVAWTIVGFFLGLTGTWLSSMHMAGPVVTLLLVFLLQHGQAKNTRALQLKLDELLAMQGNARPGTIKAEQRSHDDLKHLEDNAQADPTANNLQDTSVGAARARTRPAPNGSPRAPRRRARGNPARRATTTRKARR